MLTEKTQIQGKVGVDRRHRGAEELGKLIKINDIFESKKKSQANKGDWVKVIEQG